MIDKIKLMQLSEGDVVIYNGDQCICVHVNDPMYTENKHIKLYCQEVNCIYKIVVSPYSDIFVRLCDFVASNKDMNLNIEKQKERTI